MTFLCRQQASIDNNGEHFITHLHIRVHPFTMSGGYSNKKDISVKTSYPSDVKYKHLWEKVKGIDEAEKIVIEKALKNCVPDKSISYSIYTVANKSHRGMGNTLVINPNNTMPYAEKTGILPENIWTNSNVPENKGILLYKGTGEIDAAFFFSIFENDERWLFFIPEWENYITVFDV